MEKTGKIGNVDPLTGPILKGMISYSLPVLIGVGAAVGCLTGIVAERVFRALHINPEKPEGRKT